MNAGKSKFWVILHLNCVNPNDWNQNWKIDLSNLKFEQICTKLLDNNFFKTLLILISRLPPRSPSHQLTINSGLNETFVQICALLSINHQRIMALFHGIETDTKTMEWIKCWNFKIFILRIKVWKFRTPRSNWNYTFWMEFIHHSTVDKQLNVLNEINVALY